jgi:hypothetical protein
MKLSLVSALPLSCAFLGRRCGTDDIGYSYIHTIARNSKLFFPKPSTKTRRMVVWMPICGSFAQKMRRRPPSSSTLCSMSIFNVQTTLGCRRRRFDSGHLDTPASWRKLERRLYGSISTWEEGDTPTATRDGNHRTALGMRTSKYGWRAH